MGDYFEEESLVEARAQDEGDENPDQCVGEEVEPEHDLDISMFEEDGGENE